MPAVFVHGVPDTHRVWNRLRGHLARTDAVALSLPGFDSPLPDGFTSTKEEYVDWIIAQIERQGEPVDLVGHDWGCILVARVASLRPDLIRTWAAGDAPVNSNYVWHPLAKIWQSPDVGEAWMKDLDPEEFTKTLLEHGVPADLATDVMGRMDATMRQCILRLYRSAVTVGREWQPGLTKITSPGLVFWGIHDIPCPVEFADLLGKDSGASRVLKLDAQHWTPVERAKELAAALEQHWKTGEKRQQMANTVKIVRFHEAGPADVLRLDDLPLPEPGPGEVRLRVRAIGLNRAEVMFRNARYPIDPVFPSNLGYEAAGIVEAIGPNVEPSLLGRTMSSVPSFWANEYGVYGEVAILPVTALAAYPAHLSYEEGASIWMQYITAWGALIHFGRLASDEHVLITAASSSVGIAAIDVARAQGAISIATTRTTEKKEQLVALGADHVIVTDREDVVARVLEITEGKGCRIIFDPVAGSGFAHLAEAAADFALISLYGVLDDSPMIYPTAIAFKKNLTVQAFTIFPLTMNPITRAEAEAYVYRHLENGNFKPLIDRSFQLSEIVEAHRYMETNQQVGKIVVRV